MISPADEAALNAVFDYLIDVPVDSYRRYLAG
jgi:hypothetical protein